MAFPSPANDYTEARLTVDSICQMDANCTVIQTATGYAVINRSLRAEQGNIVLITHCGRTQFAKLMGSSLITEEGEALEGDVLDDVTVSGVMTYEINVIRRAEVDEIPVI
ncbi:hypothetical protein G6546_14220 [Citrobacter portucalensis]|uniref:hypothetical protein n=1 Tax=Citrobacter portucalensis TaxID=1639133 RepID=UPI00140F509D|nr:hypothetical protein [Citrobacter portucalensis]NHR81987.1 hypothetical protein [Citrobacter portucalensis]